MKNSHLSSKMNNTTFDANAFIEPKLKFASNGCEEVKIAFFSRSYLAQILRHCEMHLHEKENVLSIMYLSWMHSILFTIVSEISCAFFMAFSCPTN